jgi:hypothetical protein
LKFKSPITISKKNLAFPGKATDSIGRWTISYRVSSIFHKYFKEAAKRILTKIFPIVKVLITEDRDEPAPSTVATSPAYI